MPYYQKKYSKIAVFTTILFLIIFLSYTSFLAYKIFFQKNAGEVELWVFTILALITLVLILTLLVGLLSRIFPNSKITKIVEKAWDKIEQLLEYAINGL